MCNVKLWTFLNSLKWDCSYVFTNLLICVLDLHYFNQYQHQKDQNIFVNKVFDIR